MYIQCNFFSRYLKDEPENSKRFSLVTSNPRFPNPVSFPELPAASLLLTWLIWWLSFTSDDCHKRKIVSAKEEYETGTNGFQRKPSKEYRGMCQVYEAWCQNFTVPIRESIEGMNDYQQCIGWTEKYHTKQFRKRT